MQTVVCNPEIIPGHDITKKQNSLMIFYSKIMMIMIITRLINDIKNNNNIITLTVKVKNVKIVWFVTM